MDAHVHLTGNVGGDVELRDTGVPVASFRLACTPRVRRNGEWVDGATTWLTVTCFRALATHVAGCIRRGDPVLVSGRLRTTTWTREGVDHERTVLEATAVGHDLSWGTSTFRRAARATTATDRSDEVGETILSAENQRADDPAGPGGAGADGLDEPVGASSNGAMRAPVMRNAA